MKKVVLFAFNGNEMCFIHVLLNALRFKEKGYDTKIVLEGEATKLVPSLFDESSMLYNLSQKVLDLNLIDGVCEACSKKMKTYDIAVEKGLNILGDVMGHPSMEKYLTEGYSIITF